TNPTGLTRVVNVAFSIFATSPARIRTNLLDLDAPNASIGTSSARLQVDLVEFIARKRVDGPSADVFRDARLLVNAGFDVFLSLRGVDRANGGTEIEVAIDRIKAGRDLDLELRTGIRQNGRGITGQVL